MSKNETKFWLVWIVFCCLLWWKWGPALLGAVFPLVRSLFFDWKEMATEIRQAEEKLKRPVDETVTPP